MADQPQEKSLEEAEEEELPVEASANESPLQSEHAILGERIAGILDAAEEAAEEIRAEARAEAASIKEDAEEAIAARRRELEREADDRRAKAEEQADSIRRSVREAASEVARQVENDARIRRGELREETRSVEAKLLATVSSLREITVQLEKLLGPEEEEEPSELASELIDLSRIATRPPQ